MQQIFKYFLTHLNFPKNQLNFLDNIIHKVSLTLLSRTELKYLFCFLLRLAKYDKAISGDLKLFRKL